MLGLIDDKIKNIKFPFFIIKPLIDRIEKWIFLDAYIYSHNEYLKRTSLGSRWKKLDENLEYDIKFENIFSNEKIPLHTIALKNRTSKVLRNIKVQIIAESDFLKYSDTIEIPFLDNKIHISHLCRIPLQEIYIENGKIFLPYDRILVSITYQLEENIYKRENYFFLTYTEYLNSEWEEKWGKIWNLDLIRRNQQRLREKLWYYLILKYQYISYKKHFS